MTMGFIGLLYAAYTAMERKIRTDGLLAILPASVERSITRQSILDVLRPPAPEDQRSFAENPIVQTGGVLAAAALISSVDEQNFAHFFRSLPDSMQNLLTMDGGIYRLLPRPAQVLLLPARGDDSKSPEGELSPSSQLRRTDSARPSSKLLLTREDSFGLTDMKGRVLHSLEAEAKGSRVPILVRATRLADAPEGKESKNDEDHKSAFQRSQDSPPRFAGPTVGRIDSKRRLGRRRTEEKKITLSDRDINQTMRAAESMIYNLVWAMYKPAERAVVSLGQESMNEAARSFVSLFSAIDQRHVNVVGGVSVSALCLQLVFVKRSRLRTLRVAELVLYFLTLLVLSGALSMTAIKAVAARILGRYQRRSRAHRSNNQGHEGRRGRGISLFTQTGGWIENHKLLICTGAGTIALLTWLKRRLRR
eukprot:CAMPEP_0185259302 /NCGR_PEP_ID=MMETSP1359-20130426/8100_1 /TAXON_ID=552665 /ORGANISM="Bigelowiella longifila, Strain CCMP242" /LENGTH=420 /DNA_ID=CAMNT_0027845155 /DNA_START=87 /DNA_END=1349 /DNA_ORIENTATION=-